MPKKNFYKRAGFAFILALNIGGSSFGQTGNCTRGICQVDDLIVENGFSWAVSNKYQLGEGEELALRGAGILSRNINSRSFIILAAEQNAEMTMLFLSKDHSVGYEQTKKIPTIMYDTLITGSLQAPSLPGATYQWYLDDVFLADGTSAKYTPATPGTYKVVIGWYYPSPVNARIEGSQTNVTTFSYAVTTVATITGLSENEQGKTASIYPNPASESVWIREAGSFNYALRDTDAKVLASGEGNNETKVDLQGLTPGIYFMEVKTVNKTYRDKVIIR